MKALLGIVAVLVLGFIAYSAIRPRVKGKTDEVYYFPRSNVYLKSATGEYFFYQPAQKSWLSTTSITGSQESALGERVTVSPAEPVWKHNFQERMVQSVNLYAAPGELKSRYVEDSVRALPRKPAPKVKKLPETPPVEEEKPKKGLKKFFDKLFKGKKEDKAPEEKNSAGR